MTKTLPEKIMEAYWVKKVPSNIKFIFSEAFVAKGAENRFNGFNPTLPKAHGLKLLLSRDQERELFLKLNYAKYRASGGTTNRSIRWWLTKASYYNDIIAYHNLNLAYKLATKLCKYGSPEELESAALFGLCKAINGFDVERGNKFSTYATWAVRTHVWRHGQHLTKHAHEDLEYQYDASDSRHENDTNIADAATDVVDLLCDTSLTPTERFIIILRFGLGAFRPATYAQLAAVLGVSKTHVANTLNQALRKINTSYDRRQKTQIRINEARNGVQIQIKAEGEAESEESEEGEG